MCYLNVLRMANRAIANGNGHQTKLARCSSNVGDSVGDKTKVGWTSPRDIWRNLSLRRKAEVIKFFTRQSYSCYATSYLSLAASMRCRQAYIDSLNISGEVYT